MRPAANNTNGNLQHSKVDRVMPIPGRNYRGIIRVVRRK